MNTLKAERRDMTIKAKKLRREGFVTGSIFGREMGETIPLKMEKGAVERLLKEEGKGGQVMLELEGRTYDALIKEVDYNPLKGCIDEIDFQALVKGEQVHSTAEVHLVNLEKLAAGVPQQMLHEIAFKALPSALADKVEEFIKEHGFKIRPEYGAFPDRPYDSPGVWGDAEKINKIMNNR